MEECRIEFEIVHGAVGADNLSMAFCGYQYREKAADPRTIAIVRTSTTLEPDRSSPHETILRRDSESSV